MTTCSGLHKPRLFIGEATFKGVYSLLEKNKNKHPNLGKSIVATELQTFSRTSDSCEKCLKIYDQGDEETKLGYDIAKLFVSNSVIQSEGFCSKHCARIQALKKRGVTIILGYDGTKMHEHSQTKNKIFPRIHWNCPHDQSNFHNQTLPPIIKDFFLSAAKMQKKGHRVHLTLAQPKGKEFFYQGAVYDVYSGAKAGGYSLYARRVFDSNRYPGYKHRQTSFSSSAPGADNLIEYVFIKGKLPHGRSPAKVIENSFYINNVFVKRFSYYREIENDSSSYSE